MNDTQVLRIGKISSVNYKNGTARVTYEDRDSSTTVELPFLAWEYWMPKIEDRVLVGHLSNGTTSAVILGTVWHEDRRPIEGAKGIYRREYEAEQGVAYERYNAEDKSFTIKAGGCTLTMKGGNIVINGSLSVSGNLSVSGTISAGGDVTSGSVSTQTHTHTGYNGETSGSH